MLRTSTGDMHMCAKTASFKTCKERMQWSRLDGILPKEVGHLMIPTP